MYNESLEFLKFLKCILDKYRSVTGLLHLPFTGNKFEFRAVGSSANPAGPMNSPECEL